MVFDFLSFTLSSITQYSYLLIFILMFVEGPIVTYAASFAASLGVFNVWIILVLAILGNILPDILFYSIGRYGRHVLSSKFFKLFKLRHSRIIKLEKMLHKHFVKALIVIKLTPFLPIPGLIIAGFIRIKFLRFVKYSLFITLPYTLFFLILGYYSGISYVALSNILNNGTMGLLVLVIIVGLTWIIYTQVVKRLLKGLN